jgi:hypothetical protein
MKMHALSAHENAKKKLFSCSKCESNFTSRSRLISHFTSIHEGIKPFKCDICDARFTSSGGQKNHMQFVHDGKKPFVCNICETKFSYQLKTHVFSVHQEKKLFNCEICGDHFSQEGTMKKHKLYVHGKGKSSKNVIF